MVVTGGGGGPWTSWPTTSLDAVCLHMAAECADHSATWQVDRQTDRQRQTDKTAIIVSYRIVSVSCSTDRVKLEDDKRCLPIYFLALNGSIKQY